MNNLNLKHIAEDLIDTFLKAGKIAKEISHKGVKITITADNSPVTNGDLIVDELLSNKIKDITPTIPIISEETVDLNNNLNKEDKDFWLVDPIDGTKDYIKKKDEYTLNAALVVNLKPVLGIIYAPEKKRLFYSYGANNAFEINNGVKKKLKSKKVSTNEIIGLEHSGVTPPEVLKIYKKYKVTKKIKMSSSLKFCILAAGEADIYSANARAFEWDIAAGHAILEHAGGYLTTHQEENILYKKKNFKNLDIIAKRSLHLEK